MNGVTFPVSIARGAFRTWFILAIAIALISVEGFFFLSRFFSNSKLLRTAVVVLLLVGIIFTSGVQKYEHNTAIWPTSGAFSTSSQSLPFEYGAFFGSLPVNTKIFLYTPRDKLVIGYGHFSCAWCQEVVDFRRDILTKDASEVYSFLKKNDYEYFVINGRMDFRYFEDDHENSESLLRQRYTEFGSSPQFKIVHQTADYVVFKIV